MDRQKKKDVFLGLDLGGTKLLVGEVDSEGNVHGNEADRMAHRVGGSSGGHL